MVIAMVLGPDLEEQFRLSLILSGGEPTVFLRHPVTLTFIVLTLLAFAGQTLSSAWHRFRVPRGGA